ncbi:MAG: tRNA uridine-5-carboxymethylaminomethyl(34) synthesis GTPase MnmE [Bacillota bacterium]
MVQINDTIVGIATPIGEGGISIIRISGEKALEILYDIFTFSGELKKNIRDIQERKFYLGKVYDEKRLLDQCMAVYMKGPRSYTGEDVVEIHCHGGILVTKKILELILHNGVRLAEPGEFTKRAFLNGKINLAQAEAVIDVITARSDSALDSAVKQLEGKLGEAIDGIMRNIEAMLANVEADIDFPDEDLDLLSVKDMEALLEECIKKIDALIKEADTGRVLREGVNTVIVGRPNVGKSSLLNALVREDKAIVTNIPGTTRDIIEDYIQIKGFLFKIIDTAGFRETEDIIEKIGLEKSYEKLQKADLVLIVMDASQALLGEEHDFIKKIIEMKDKVMIIINKVDLEKVIVRKDLVSSIFPGTKVLEISATEKVGLKLLEEEIINMVFEGKLSPGQDYLVTRVRHKNLLINAKKRLEDARETISRGLAEEFLSIDLRDAWRLLGQITGNAVDEDIIDKIFSEFCIGK